VDKEGFSESAAAITISLYGMIRAVLRIHAKMVHQHHEEPLAAVMHQGGAQRRQHDFLEE
jgi:hypothetical protein